MREGTFPRSTLGGAAGFGAGGGSGAPQGESVATEEDQGSNIALLLDAGTAAGLGAGGCVLVGCEERLKAEEMSLLDDLGRVGEVIFGAGG